MKAFYYLTILFLSVGSFNTGLAATCEINQSKDKDVHTRAIWVEFPDGRRLTVLGEIHGDFGTVSTEIIGILKRKVISNHDLIYDVKDVVYHKNKRAFNSRKESLTFIKKLIIQEHINFIGIEEEPSETENFNLVRNGINRYTLLEFQDRKITNPTLRQDISLLISGAPWFLKERNPSLFKNIDILPIEGPAKLKANNKIYDMNTLVEVSEAQVSQAKKMKLTSDLIEKLYLLPHELIDSYHTLLPVWDKMTDELIRQFPSKFYTPLLRSLSEYKSVLEVLNERDEQIVENMLKRNQSGLVVIGRAHVNSIAEKLSKKCMDSWIAENESASSSSNRFGRQ